MATAAHAATEIGLRRFATISLPRSVNEYGHRRSSVSASKA
ncbi:hypothetical protein BTZ20_5115 [Rhodococcus sp. MTM3W5.2]|nr:hypothetical protein BTZ20_5115 [Rhodococcus sp. MTM3W5.2]